MSDRDPSVRVGEVIWDTKYLLVLPVGTHIGHNPAYDEVEDDTDERWVRTVNGYVCTRGNEDVDTGHFVANNEVLGYFEPGMNLVTYLDVPEKTVEPTEPSGCDCGNCDCKGVAEDGEPAVAKEEFVPKYPNDPDDPNRETPRQDVLREAEHLVSADRNQEYGEPTDNFATIAEMLTSRFRHLLKPGRSFVGSDVGDIQIITKVARNIALKKRDSYTDIAGYAACAYECTFDED